MVEKDVKKKKQGEKNPTSSNIPCLKTTSPLGDVMACVRLCVYVCEFK